MMIPETGASLDESLRVILGNPVMQVLVSTLGDGLGILRASDRDLQKLPSVGRQTVRKIHALRSMGKQMVLRERAEPVVYITGPSDAYEYLAQEMRSLDREHFRAVLLNTKNRVIGIRTISIGSLNASTVHPREVFKAAVAESACSILLVHNHPSGNPEPSPEDVAVTERLVDAGRLLGINVLDHIIVGESGCASLRELDACQFDG